MEAIPHIEMIFREDDLSRQMAIHNFKILNSWASYLPGMLEDIALSCGGKE